MARTEFNCNTDLSNVANHDCTNEWGALRRAIIVPKYDSDGNLNYFANLAAFTKAALQAKFNATLLADRFFPTCLLNNVEAPSVDPKVESDDMEVDHFIRHGVEMVKAKMWEVNHKYIARWANFNYKAEMCYFPIDLNGNIEYLTDAATELEIHPIPIESLYFDRENPQTESVFKGTMSFKVNLQGANKYLRRVINIDDLDFNPLSTSDVYGLYDVTIAETVAAGAAGATLSFYIDGNSSQPVLGLAKTDLVLQDDTPSAEVITTLTEVGAGIYTAAWTLGADNYTLAMDKDKYASNTLAFTVT